MSLYWVIKFDNDTYNLGEGHEVLLRECTKYATKEDAEKTAEELCGVESILQISDEKDYEEDQAVLIVSDLFNAGLIQNEEDHFNHAVNIVIKRLKLINENVHQ